MVSKKLTKSMFAGVAAGVLSMAAINAHAECTTTIGGVMALTGSLGALGQQIGEGAQLAVSDINAAGGVNGCKLKFDLYDDQTNPAVGVDAAKKLVDINRVPVIIGALSSGVSMAILTSVTSSAHVVQISPASTSPTFTQLAQEGRTGGYWFRTVPSDALQGTAMAMLAHQHGLKSVAVMYINNPYGTGLAGKFANYFKKMGGTVTAEVPYNDKQPSYRSEVNQALSGKPQALFLVGYPGDGTTVAREWISAGGPMTFLLPDGLESQKFVDDVGPQYLKTVYGTAAGSEKTPSLATFKENFKKKHGSYPTQAYMTNAYDAVMIAALAMESGKSDKAPTIRDNIRKVTGMGGTPIYAGVDGFKKASMLLKAGKKVHYVGASGPLSFDQYGDVTAPMVVWTVKGGKVAETGMIKVDAINKVLKQYAK
ncbi:hypothetical protein BI364_15785 [Acidihalobacter yilgarnensis]|uniref:Leucine-binding protein domain-containing protein n=1 Tax=Acidihalobacter yilgarnensis TaxID=2819280 RepID=A0A1D8IRS6_9GAMM|nr:ABC transporter substrate-binding protein [Acidihalobacter yilgarnensis]AOU99201.1 hypothetical protein BI364_15785 [Acidihalobacter yilgarnensis]